MGYSRSSMPVAVDARPRDLEGIVQANPGVGRGLNRAVRKQVQALFLEAWMSCYIPFPGNIRRGLQDRLPSEALEALSRAILQAAGQEFPLPARLGRRACCRVAQQEPSCTRVGVRPPVPPTSGAPAGPIPAGG